MVKRVVDIVFGSVLAIAVLPVTLVLAVAIAIQFRAWPFFVQERLGRGGRTFRIVKLRTMPVDAPAYATKYRTQRIQLPRLAQVLRQLHLDELPQLWLVPFGRMSLVGPRPEMAFLHGQLPPEVAAHRLSVRPGCTGLWQISVDHAGLIEEHPEYDALYVDQQRLRLDAWIVWHTVRTMLARPRHLTLDTLPPWVRGATSSARRAEREPAAA